MSDHIPDKNLVEYLKSKKLVLNNEWFQNKFGKGEDNNTKYLKHLFSKD